jgi:hypothetical protein
MCLKRSQVVERTAAATGVSVRSVRNIHKEFQLQDGTLLTPVKQYAASRVRVLEKLKEECSFPGGRYCLWRVLCDMGFSFTLPFLAFGL